MESPNDAPGHVTVGKVSRPQGVAGELRVAVMSDFPGRFAVGESVFIGGEEHRIQRSYRPRGGTVVVKLEGVDSHQQAEALREANITVPRNRVPPLPEGQFYHFQLLGMDVYTSAGEYLGRIAGILPTGSNDVYIVSHGKQEVLIPALDEVIQEVDVEVARMTVDLPEGLR